MGSRSAGGKGRETRTTAGAGVWGCEGGGSWVGGLVREVARRGCAAGAPGTRGGPKAAGRGKSGGGRAKSRAGGGKRRTDERGGGWGAQRGRESSGCGGKSWQWMHSEQWKEGKRGWRMMSGVEGGGGFGGAEGLGRRAGGAGGEGKVEAASRRARGYRGA
ncbi:hypothetical protein A6V37_37635 [Paraburkholderia ginsengiterrae]|uniref:Uncharacterized protein n=1 Tax=Paraburkholderia ginsengiterrae TaxID=1462993 RepID=A0A1A9NHB0_9BURK|nr:hypothetical protein A6V37_37635 [Paraburkholderia ginsengiterrae]